MLAAALRNGRRRLSRATLQGHAHVWSSRLVSSGPSRLSPDETLLINRRVTQGAVLFRLFLNPAKVLGRLGDVAFIDLAQAGHQLVPGRPFGMVENAAGQRMTLVSPLTAEIAEVNPKVIDDVSLLLSGADGAGGAGGVDGDGWVMELDPFIEEGDPDPEEWSALRERGP